MCIAARRRRRWRFVRRGCRCFFGLVAATSGKRHALLCDFLQSRCDTRLILENPSLEQKTTEGKEHLTELFDARLEFLYARLQLNDRGVFSPAICLLRDAKLLSTSLNSLSQLQLALYVVVRYVPTSGTRRSSVSVRGRPLLRGAGASVIASAIVDCF